MAAHDIAILALQLPLQPFYKLDPNNLDELNNPEHPLSQASIQIFVCTVHLNEEFLSLYQRGAPVMNAYDAKRRKRIHHTSPLLPTNNQLVSSSAHQLISSSAPPSHAAPQLQIMQQQQQVQHLPVYTYRILLGCRSKVAADSSPFPVGLTLTIPLADGEAHATSPPVLVHSDKGTDDELLEVAELDLDTVLERRRKAAQEAGNYVDLSDDVQEP